MKINLDGLNPTNTFERRIMQALVDGESLPVNVTFHTEEIERRLKELESKIGTVSDSLGQFQTVSDSSRQLGTVADSPRIAALESQILDLMKAVQLLLQAHEDEKRKTHTMRRILIELTDQIDTKLKATG